MATNSKLKKALLDKLGITRQALSQQVQTLKKKIPITTEDATYFIAHKNGIKIDRYLEADEVARVRHLVVSSQSPTSMQANSPTKSKNHKIDSVGTQIIFPREFKGSDPLLPSSKIKEAKDMAAVYPILYVMENSIRELIERVMRAKYGDIWWTTKTQNGKLRGIRERAETRMKKETTNRWHQKRGARPLDYVDLDDLKAVLSSEENEFFPNILSTKEWFLQFMRELEPSRNVLCHMNPLSSVSVQDIKVKFARWERMIRENLANIP